MCVRQAAPEAACLRESQPIPNIRADFLRFTSKLVLIKTRADLTQFTTMSVVLDLAMTEQKLCFLFL